MNVEILNYNITPDYRYEEVNKIDKINYELKDFLQSLKENNYDVIDIKAVPYTLSNTRTYIQYIILYKERVY